MFESVKENKLGLPSLVESNKVYAVVRITECATCWGLSNVGWRVCTFDAGIQTGFLSAFTGKRIVSTETRCYASGDKCCEFKIRVLSPELAFKEAFEV